jgi:hypothetical protein
MLTPLRHLIPPLTGPGVRACRNVTPPRHLIPHLTGPGVRACRNVTPPRHLIPLLASPGVCACRNVTPPRHLIPLLAGQESISLFCILCGNYEVEYCSYAGYQKIRRYNYWPVCLSAKTLTLAKSHQWFSDRPFMFRMCVPFVLNLNF